MGNQIILSPEAEQDLDEIVARIAKDNPAAAEKFGIRLLDRLEILKSFPRLGREVSGRRGERILVEGPILISGFDIAALLWHHCHSRRISR